MSSCHYLVCLPNALHPQLPTLLPGHWQGTCRSPSTFAALPEGTLTRGRGLSAPGGPARAPSSPPSVCLPGCPLRLGAALPGALCLFLTQAPAPASSRLRFHDAALASLSGTLFAGVLILSPPLEQRLQEGQLLAALVRPCRSVPEAAAGTQQGLRMYPLNEWTGLSGSYGFLAMVCTKGLAWRLAHTRCSTKSQLR